MVRDGQTDWTQGRHQSYIVYPSHLAWDIKTINPGAALRTSSHSKDMELRSILGLEVLHLELSDQDSQC